MKEATPSDQELSPEDLGEQVQPYSEPIVKDSDVRNFVREQVPHESEKVNGEEALAMDGEYFRNKENVRADLEGFASEVKRGVTRITAGSIASVSITYSNGEQVKGATYLKRAARALSLAGNFKEAGNKQTTALDELLRLAGYEVVQYPKMNEEYFRNKEKVHSDLENFAATIKKGVTEITASNIRSKDIICSNGKQVKGSTYLRCAARALGLAGNDKETGNKQTTALDELLRLAVYKYQKMDEEYFRNKENVRADLEKFASEVKRGVTRITAGSIASVSITYSNGERVKGATYLNRAARALGLTGNDKEAGSKGMAVLNELLRLAGYEVVQYSKMDGEYFRNKENVRADLEGFASEVKRGVTGIAAGSIASVSITSSNDEQVKGATYLRRAARALGLASNRKEAGSKQTTALDELLRLAVYKYQKMDEEYFRNKENVRADLEKFAIKSGKKSIKETKTGRIQSVEIICSNGERVKGATYLNRAARALGLTGNDKEAGSKGMAVLNELLRLAGYEVVQYSKMDGEYFRNKENVRADLEGFAIKSGKKSIKETKTGRIQSIEIICSNGERVKGDTYLRRATRALGLASNDEEAGSKKMAALDELLNLAGYEVVKYPKMDGEYFRNEENVRADLKGFAIKSGKKAVAKLTTTDFQSMEITCCNGEQVKGQTYLKRAARALSLAGAQGKPAATIEELLHLIGLETRNRPAYASATLPDAFNKNGTGKRRGIRLANRKREEVPEGSATFAKGEAFEQIVGVTLAYVHDDQTVVPQYCLRTDVNKGTFGMRVDFKVGDDIYEVKWGNAKENIHETVDKQLAYIESQQRYHLLRLFNEVEIERDDEVFARVFASKQTADVSALLEKIDKTEVEATLSQLTNILVKAAEDNDLETIQTLRNFAYSLMEEANGLKGQKRKEFLEKALGGVQKILEDKDTMIERMQSAVHYRYSPLLAHFEQEGKIYRTKIHPKALQEEDPENYGHLYFFDDLTFSSELDRDIAVMLELSDVDVRADDILVQRINGKREQIKTIFKVPVIRKGKERCLKIATQPNGKKAHIVRSVRDLRELLPFERGNFLFGRKYLALEKTETPEKY